MSIQKNNIVATCIALLCSLCLFGAILFVECNANRSAFTLQDIRIWRFVVITVVAVAIFNYLASNTSKKLQTLFDMRWPIAIGLFVTCVLLDLNGSSLGLLSELCGGQNEPLAGTSRPIRSDEWMIFTPMSISQCTTDGGVFSYFQNSFRSVSTDMYLVYGQPVYDPAIIFRPFQLGYLFLGPSRGLSFFWCGRMIFLFFVSLEFSYRVLQSKAKLLHFVYACMVAFSGIVQWWFAVNGLVEMLLFGQLALIWLNSYMDTCKKGARVLYALGIGWCLSVFLLTLYPAWEIPLGYIFLAFLIGLFIHKGYASRLSRFDLIPCLLCFGFVALSIFYVICIKSWETVEIVSGTAYPGDRLYLGGSDGSLLFAYLFNPIMPFNSHAVEAINSNACESATFYTAFPLCVIYPACILVKKRGRDAIIVALLVACIIVCLYGCLGVSEPIAEFTLLGKSTSYRILQIVGYAFVLLLFYSLSSEMKLGRKTQLATIGASLAIIAFALVFYFGNMRKAYIVIAFLLVAAFSIAVYFAANRIRMRDSSCTLVAVCILCGLFVNPLTTGIQGYLETPLAQGIQSTSTENDVWAIVDADAATNNVPPSLGRRTLNSTNTYPQLDTWHRIDPESKYEEIYNRYANILIHLKDEGPAEFELKAQDSFKVNLTIDDLRKLGVTKVLTTSEAFATTPPFSTVAVGEHTSYKIYDISR